MSYMYSTKFWIHWEAIVLEVMCEVSWGVTLHERAYLNFLLLRLFWSSGKVQHKLLTEVDMYELCWLTAIRLVLASPVSLCEITSTWTSLTFIIATVYILIGFQSHSWGMIDLSSPHPLPRATVPLQTKKDEYTQGLFHSCNIQRKAHSIGLEILKAFPLDWFKRLVYTDASWFLSQAFKAFGVHVVLAAQAKNMGANRLKGENV